MGPNMNHGTHSVKAYSLSCPAVDDCVNSVSFSSPDHLWLKMLYT